MTVFLQMFHKCFTPTFTFFYFFFAGVAGQPGFLVLRIQTLRRWPGIPFDFPLINTFHKNMSYFPYVKIAADASWLQVCEEFWPGNLLICYNFGTIWNIALTRVLRKLSMALLHFSIVKVLWGKWSQLHALTNKMTQCSVPSNIKQGYFLDRKSKWC